MTQRLLAGPQETPPAPSGAGLLRRLAGLAQVHLRGAERLCCRAPHYGSLQQARQTQKCPNFPRSAAASKDKPCLSETTAAWRRAQGWDGGAGTCTAPGMPGQCQAGNPPPLHSHHPWLGHPRLREGPRTTVGQSTAALPSPAGDGPSFFLLYICTMPSTK